MIRKSNRSQKFARQIQKAISKAAIILFGPVIICIPALAQPNAHNPGAQFPTPNTAAFHVYGQYPQTSNTGVPNVNVPIYDFTYQGMSLPIQLAYNTNAVKPNTYPGWVGLGWTLTAGGSITREIKGWPDDESWITSGMVKSTNQTNIGYFYNHGYLAPSNWNDPYRIQLAALDLDQYNFSRYDYNFGTSIKDYSPDEFRFSVGNISGMFCLDHNGEWKVRSSSKIKVLAEVVEQATPPWPASNGFPATYFPNSKSFYRFTLTDEKGIKYIFGGGTGIEGAMDGIKTWNLTSIVFPNGKTIKYSYKDGNEMILEAPTYFQSGSGWDYSWQYTRPAYLSTIETDLTTIQFLSSAATGEFYKLNEIVVTDKVNGRQLGKYAFTYLSTTSPMNKLRLISLTQLDLKNAEVAKYSMGYNASQFSGHVQANHLFYKTDHWGYFSLIPFDLTGSDQYHASRRADTTNCRTELLDRITYPTGGYTQYTWAPNDFSKAVSEEYRTSLTGYSANQYAGGVRIKQINNYDKDNNRVGYKKYVYVNGFTPGNQASAPSSGVLSYTPGAAFAGYWYYSLPRPEWKHSIANTPHITYSEVTEINSDGSLINTIFSNFDNGVNNEYMDDPAVGHNPGNVGGTYSGQFSSNSHERGLPLEVTIYNNNFQLISKNTTQYIRIDKQNEYVRAIDIWTEPGWTPLIEPNYTSNTAAMGWHGSAYKIYTNAYLPSTVTEKTYIDYDPLKFVTTTTSYIYDPVTLNPSTITKVNSKGENINAYNIYPNNMVAQNRDPTNVYSRMVAANNVSSIVETITKKFDTPLSVQHTDYSEPVTGQFKPIVETEQYGYGPTRNLNYYDAFDAAGNLTSIHKNGGSNNSYIYGYFKNKPIAEIKNANSLECYFEGFEDSGAYGIAHTGRRYKEGPFAISFSPPNGRLYQLSYWYRTSPSGSWTYAIEDYTAPKTIRSGTNDDIDDIRIFPADAQMTTYTYDAAGISSVTDVKNRSVYYEYDDAGRLRIVRDNEKNIVKRMCYNYAGQTTGCLLETTYSNDQQTAVFKKNDCGVGYIPSPATYTYIVPAGKYQSAISKEDANQQAIADLTITGQLRVNQGQTCTFGAIFARVEVEDIVNDGEYVRGMFFVRFYSDANCTSAFAIPYDMDLGLKMDYTDINNTTPVNIMPGYMTATSGVTQIQIGTITATHLTDEQFRYHVYTYNIPNGIYTAKPTYGDSYLYW